MKITALFSGILLLILTLNSCCSGSGAGCGSATYEAQVTEWVEEEVYVDKAGPTIVRTPIVTTETRKIKCIKCNSFYRTCDGCCDTVGVAVLKRATVQGGTGEPHMGLIPTMKILAP